MIAYSFQLPSMRPDAKSDSYQDIREIGRPVPLRPRMPRANRAKLFAPYDALKPFEATVHAKDVVYVPRIELGDYAQECLDGRLRVLKRGDLVTVTWFQPYGSEEHLGQYIKTSGRISKIDANCQLFYLGKQIIPIPDIINIGGERFEGDSEG